MVYSQYIDNGNGRFKASTSTNRKARMLSLVGTGFKRKHSLPGTQQESSGYMATDTLHVSIRDLNSPLPIPTEYFVGELARSESKDAERVFNTMDFSDERIAVAIATISALLNPFNSPLDRLCLGLPLGIYNEQKEAMREFASNINMEVKFISGGSNDQPILVRPKKVWVYPQCGAGVFSALFNRDGSLKQGIDVGLYAGVDIGWETTDFMVIEVLPGGKARIRGDMTDTIEVGLSKIVELCRSHLENEHGSINRNEFENQLLIHPQNVFCKGQNYDMRALFEHHSKAIASAIVTGVRRKWGDKASYIRNTFLFGGGANDLAKYLNDNFPTPRSVLEEPDMANLRGYEIMNNME